MVDVRDKAALVTLCLSQLPTHPSYFLGYGSAVLSEMMDLDIIDINAEFHYRNRLKLEPILQRLWGNRLVADSVDLYPFYDESGSNVDSEYSRISWEKYSFVYVTQPSWFPTVTTEAVMRLYSEIKRVSPHTVVRFFGNSLGSWTKEDDLKKNGVEVTHLNALTQSVTRKEPIRYDLLPPPVYENREKYLFDLLPFMLKHGCSWGRCKFCSLCRGWNSGYVERSVKAVIKELESVIDHHHPAALVCRDNSIKGQNLLEFCRYFSAFDQPWCGMSRADLTVAEIEALQKAGCRLIFFGLESGSNRTLKAIDKGITCKQMSNFIKRLHSSGIFPVPSLMIGLPHEEPSDFEKTIEFVVDHRSYLEIVNVYPFIATPSSEFGSQEKHVDEKALLKVFRFIQVCEELGLRVCLGEQCMEYLAFQWLLDRDTDSSQRPIN